ncbi:hypothetical protein [Collinsella ihumii]|uniref:hypothetical protein n=1 Tax=Collinsella ihumii TaxID=1720204 RepID=UPI000834F15C|nr:hypothetical protein [Collinsella ihumii]
MPTFTEDTVIKTGTETSDELLCEAAGLRWLAEAEADGGIRCARVLSASRRQLVEERIRTGAPSRAAARSIGEGGPRPLQTRAGCRVCVGYLFGRAHGCVGGGPEAVAYAHLGV